MGLAIMASMVVAASGHGIMHQPMPRQNAAADTSVDKPGCMGDACLFFSQGCIPGCQCDGQHNRRDDPETWGCSTMMEPTNNDTAARTWNIAGKSMDGDWTKYHPWRAPGYSRLEDPCGVRAGVRGSELPVHKDKIETWIAGSTAWAWWSLLANHGGGYQYRLCPRNTELTDACFDANPVSFASGNYTIRYHSGPSEMPDVVHEAVDVSVGTKPSGSTWRRSPVPGCNCDQIASSFDTKGTCALRPEDMGETVCRHHAEWCTAYEQQEMPSWYQRDRKMGGFNCDTGFQFPPPAQGVYGGAYLNDHTQDTESLWVWSIGDELLVPNMQGDFVLQWRWDCEESVQVWTSCADINIVGRSPTNLPTPEESVV